MGRQPPSGKGEENVNKQKRPSGWHYGLAVLIPVLSCLIAVALVWQWFPGLPGTFGAKMDLNNMTQVVVPGSQEIAFAERGVYAVYYEYRSVVNGVVFASSETPPPLDCKLTSRVTDADVAVVPDYVKTNTYATKNQERVGVLIRSMSVDEPGIYTFSCRRVDGSSQPEIVLAVGPNFAWEFLSTAVKTVLTSLAGLAVLFGSGTLAIIIVIAVAFRRRKSELASAAGQP
jgi:hypothetical protein